MTTTVDDKSFERFDPKQQSPAATVKIRPLRGSVYMLEGSGGSVTLSAGPDGIFLVDDFYDVMWSELQTALASLSTGASAAEFSDGQVSDGVRGTRVTSRLRLPPC